MKAKQLDKKFDEGEDITKYLDVSKAHRPGAGAATCQRRLSDLDDPLAGQGSEATRRAASVHYQGMGGRTPREEEGVAERWRGSGLGRFYAEMFPVMRVGHSGDLI